MNNPVHRNRDHKSIDLHLYKPSHIQEKRNKIIILVIIKKKKKQNSKLLDYYRMSYYELLTPWPKHSTPLLLAGHLVWSIYGNRLTHVWFTHTKFRPHGVPSWTKPFCVNSGDVAAPLVDLRIIIIIIMAMVFMSEMVCGEWHTYLHSYSEPLIDMIVFELICSESIFGCRSPSLHCNEPQTTFLYFMV